MSPVPQPLVCPDSGLALERVTLAEAEARLGASNGLHARSSGVVPAVGVTPSVLVRSDDGAAYPLLGDVPVLIPAERLSAAPHELDLRRASYAEAYDEMSFYNASAERWADRLADALAHGAAPDVDADDPVGQALHIAGLASLPADELASFPDPRERWLHLRFESAALEDTYRHVAPLAGRRVLQIGGIGLDAVKFALAGAAGVFLASPMLSELRFGRLLAERCGVAPRLTGVACVAEKLPFEDSSFDVVFLPGSLHHTATEQAIGECARVLRPGGKFAAVEPWRAPGYGIGTRLFGKREPVACRPLTRERVAPLFGAFADAAVVHHGALTRYALIALDKLGLRLSPSAVRRVVAADDAFCRRLAGRSWGGSSVALLAIG
jgi:ubiquinone/menaquinone biosynthesis C-methylase UbiE